MGSRGLPFLAQLARRHSTVLHPRASVVSMMLLGLLLCLLSCAVVECGNNTVTEEVYFDFLIESEQSKDEKGRVVMGVFGEAVPISALNFVLIARGYERGRKPYTQKLHYKGTQVHRVVPDFVVQLGDVTVGDGSGGRSIYGTRFDDENFILSHRSQGWLAWANHGPDSNGSQFYITLAKARWLDQKNVVFAKVVKGMEMLLKIGAVESDPLTSAPKQKVKIIDSGVIGIAKPYDVSDEGLDSDYDLLESQKVAPKKDDIKVEQKKKA